MRLRMFSTLFLLMDVTETARRHVVAEQGDEDGEWGIGSGEWGKERRLPHSLLPIPHSRLQLYFDIALATPVVKRASTASAASATIRASSTRSFFGNSDRTKSDASFTGWSGAMPRRSRGKSCPPNFSMIDFKPFWPPALPRARMRILPKGSANSSLTTRIEERSGSSYFFINAAT